MTVEVYSSPGTETWRSTKFSATVNLTAAYVYGYSRTVKLASPHWTVNTAMEQSWLTFGADETATVEITRLAGAVTSCTVYPNDGTVTPVISGSTVTLTVPTNTRLWVEMNGDRKNVLHLFSSPLEDAVGGGATDYSATTPASIADDEEVYFPPGVYTIGRLYRLGNRSIVHIQGGAVVIGSFDVRAKQDIQIKGHGVLSGTFETPEVVEPLSFAASIEYMMFVGRDNVTWDYSNSVEGITIVANPTFLCSEGIYSWRNVQQIMPWYWSCDGFECSPHPTTEESEIIDCYSYNGDDCLKLDAGNPYGTTTVDGCFCICVSNGCFGFGYWGYNDQTASELIDCHAMHMGTVDVDSDVVGAGIERGQNTVVKIWVDQPKSKSSWGRRNITFDNLKVWGTMASRFLSFETLPYVYDVAQRYDGFGEIENIILDGVTIEETPGQVSRIVGTNANNTPHDIDFIDVTIGGVPLSARNFNTFFETNDGNYLYNITIDGVTMVTAVDICNTALSYLGDEGRVASISPLDGTTQSKLCARFYPMARDAILEAHEWSFATKRVELTEVTTDETTEWDYCYQIPTDMLRALAIQPDESTADYVVPTTAAYPLVGSGAKVTQEYAIELDADDTLRIFTDQEDAWLRYTAYVTDPGLFSPLFVQAVSWKLAAMLAGPLLKGEAGAAEAKRCEQVALAYLSKASVSDAKQRQSHPTQVVPWINGR